MMTTPPEENPCHSPRLARCRACSPAWFSCRPPRPGSLVRDTGRHEAADIVDKAPDGEPLEVVVTSRAADGKPVISTILVKTRSKARDLVAQALGRSKTIGAEMNHRVSIDAYNDTYRSQQWALTALKAETVHATTRGLRRHGGRRSTPA